MKIRIHIINRSIPLEICNLFTRLFLVAGKALIKSVFDSDINKYI